MGFDSFGLNAENAAIQRDEHPATFTYANIATQMDSCKRFGASFDWTRTLQHQRPGVLPLDPVAVPEVLRARPGLPEEEPGQLVPARPDRAGQRAGDRRPLRALRRRGHQARADPVVLQDHRLRPGAAGLPGRPGADLARARDHRAAQLDRALRGRPRDLPGRGPRATSRSTRHGPTPCSARRSWWWRPTPRWPASWSPTSSARRTTRTWTEVRKASDIDRLATDRPKTGVFLGVHATNPVTGAADPGLRRRLRAGRLRHGRDHGRARSGPARLGLREGLRPAGDPHRAAVRGLRGRGVHRRRARP